MVEAYIILEALGKTFGCVKKCVSNASKKEVTHYTKPKHNNPRIIIRFE